MNALAMNQSVADAFIFGDSLLHVRFFTAIELLAQLMLVAPRTMTATKLSDEAGQPLRLVRALLQNLCQSGLVEQDAKAKDAWFCAGGTNAVTLADIFRCVSVTVTESDSSRKAKCANATGSACRSTTQQSVDLLLMQATMAVNQVVLQHLQQFDLSRLKSVAASHPFGPLRLHKRAGLPDPH